MACIYQIQGCDGKRWIGSSNDFNKRIGWHFADLKAGNHHSPKLQNTYNKYGKDWFSAFKLYDCAPEEMLFWEQTEIDTLKPEYNVSQIAGRVEWTPELRAHMREINLGRKHTPATLAKFKGRISPNKGKKILYTGGFTGHRHSSESKQKISDSLRKRKELA